MERYTPQGICPKEIQFDIIDNTVRNVNFVGGCPGNLKAISKLVDGMPTEKVIELLKGNQCRNQTSCADQLARALEERSK